MKPIQCVCIISHQFFGAVINLWISIISFIMSVHRSIWNNSVPTGQIFMKFDIWGFRNFKFHYNWTRIKGTLHEDQYTFFIISCSFLLRMRNVSDKFVENIKKHTSFFLYIYIYRKSCHLLNNGEKYFRFYIYIYI